jgi:hypothetical protein
MSKTVYVIVSCLVGLLGLGAATYKYVLNHPQTGTTGQGSSTFPNTAGVVAPSQPTQKTTLPAQVLDLENWRLALPTDTVRKGVADQIDQPELSAFTHSAYFYITGDASGVVFRAHAGGATTKGSKYPRSELREMTDDGQDEAAWSNTSGKHTMAVTETINHLPSAKPELVAAQIHDDDDDIIMVRLEKNRLFIEAGGKNVGDLDTNYQLGTKFTVKIVAEKGHMSVFYNDIMKVDYYKPASELYFKAGCYTQSNTSKGDAADAYGEVIIHALSVSHS